MSGNGVSRRRFFFGTLLAGTVPAGGYGSVASLRALGYKAFYDKLNVASVGCGGQGGVDLVDASRTENIVALCDVDENRAAENLSRFGKAAKYKDFRVMLDKEGKNIDACTIGIPDFMHATVALACMERGKHVYLEKPLTKTPWEAQLLKDAAAKYKVATQMGNQGFSHECIRVCAEILWSGAIGEVREVHISTTPGTHPTGTTEPPPASPVPKTLDWDLWQARSEPRPYSQQYVPYNWRGFLDYGTGQIGNWATHTASPAQFALLLGAPTTVECIRVDDRSKYTYPKRGTVRLDFPARGEMPPVTVYYHDSVQPDDPDAYHVPGMENERILPPSNNLTDKGRPMGRGASGGGAPGAGGRGRGGAPGAGGSAARGAGASGGRPAPPRTSPGGRGVAVFGPPLGDPRPGILSGNGSVFIGSKGIMATNERGEGVWLLPNSRWQDYALPPELLTRSPGHMLDWIRACKGGDPSVSDFSTTGPFGEWLALAAIALRVPGKLEWDSKNLRIANNADANLLVKPIMRKGWELKL
ncbi:MAG: Gfo/Idh/MocA family oxidoreductase [Bryobacteraceae bacterium]|jgi:predicted dehydrogenase